MQRLIALWVMLVAPVCVSAQSDDFVGVTTQSLPIQITLDPAAGVSSWQVELQCGGIEQTVSQTINPPCEIDGSGDFECGTIESCFFGSSFQLMGNLLGDTATGSVSARIQVPLSFPAECCDVTVSYSAMQQADEDFLFSDSFETLQQR